MAMACLRLVTFLPLRPLLSWPRLNSCISRFTSLPAEGEYLRVEDFLVEAFFVEVFFVADLRAVLFFAADFFAGALRAVDFFAGAFLVLLFLTAFFVALLVAIA